MTLHDLSRAVGVTLMLVSAAGCSSETELASDTASLDLHTCGLPIDCEGHTSDTGTVTPDDFYMCLDTLLPNGGVNDSGVVLRTDNGGAIWTSETLDVYLGDGRVIRHERTTCPDDCEEATEGTAMLCNVEACQPAAEGCAEIVDCVPLAEDFTTCSEVSAALSGG